MLKNQTTYNVDLYVCSNVGYTGEIDMIIAQADLNGTIEELRNLSIQFGSFGQSALQMNIDDIILELENIRDNIVPNLRNQVVSCFCLSSLSTHLLV